ncbi:hypothetical protein C8F01DRAFT_668826 [Mycena amicta]|nr:hypothetical protein C8F01DRAFT_668826 [Mycena amicta]
MLPSSYSSSYSPLATSPIRERRQWTAGEDDLLRRAVNLEEPGSTAPSKWHAIAQHVPNRTNKDCRKRWYAKMNSDVVKGGWAPDEDARLLQAIDIYGTRWSLVASMVQTRNSDQCAKRWGDTLNPAIDRTAWTASQDDLLIQAVNEHGKVWTKIVQMYFPGRTGLAAKNRYNSVTRSEGSPSRRLGLGRSSHSRSPDSSPSPSNELEAIERELVPSYPRYTPSPSPYLAQPQSDFHGARSSNYNSPSYNTAIGANTMPGYAPNLNYYPSAAGGSSSGSRYTASPSPSQAPAPPFQYQYQQPQYSQQPLYGNVNYNAPPGAGAGSGPYSSGSGSERSWGSC